MDDTVEQLKCRIINLEKCVLGLGLIMTHDKNPFSDDTNIAIDSILSDFLEATKTFSKSVGVPSLFIRK